MNLPIPERAYIKLSFEASTGKFKALHKIEKLFLDTKAILLPIVSCECLRERIRQLFWYI